MRSWKLRKLFALIVFGVIGALLSFRELHRAAEVPRREGQPSADSVAQSVQRAAEEKDGEPGWWCHSARSRKARQSFVAEGEEIFPYYRQRFGSPSQCVFRHLCVSRDERMVIVRKAGSKHRTVAAGETLEHPNGQTLEVVDHVDGSMEMVHGDSLVLRPAYRQIHVTHWLEHIVPAHSVVRTSPDAIGKQYGHGPGGIAMILFLNTAPFSDWFPVMRHSLEIALGYRHVLENGKSESILSSDCGTSHSAPRIQYSGDSKSPDWLCFERAVVPTTDTRLFSNAGDVDSFREIAYRISKPSAVKDPHTTCDQTAQQQLSPPDEIWFMNRDSGLQGTRRILNADAIIAAFKDECPGMIVKANQLHKLSFAEQVQQLKRTAIFITTHGSQIGNCIFMQPGSVLIEVLPYKFDDSRFGDMAREIGLHYIAWRNPYLNLSRMGSPEDYTPEMDTFPISPETEPDPCYDQHDACFANRRNADTIVHMEDFRVVIKEAFSRLTRTYHSKADQLDCAIVSQTDEHRPAPVDAAGYGTFLRAQSDSGTSLLQLKLGAQAAQR